MTGVPTARTAILLALVVAALPAAAQYAQYTEPGQLAIAEPPSRERFDQAMSEARWRLGGLRLDPWIGLKDMRWVDDTGVPGVDSDFTATVGVGLYGYTRIGSDVVVAGRVLPEYVWWNELDERNGVNGRYSLGVFGFFSRLRFQLSADRQEQDSYLSTEVEQIVTMRRDRGEAAFELDLPGRLALFAGVTDDRYRYPDEDIWGVTGPLLLGLERDQQRLRAGLKISIGSRLAIGLGVESSDTEFVRPEYDRSSTGTGPLVTLDLGGDGPFRGRLVVVWPELEPEPGSAFVPFDDPLGTFVLTWQPRDKLKWELYGGANLVYSISPESPYYRDERVGLAAGWPLGWRTKLRLFAETGTDDYAEPEPGLASLDQDRTSYGASLQLDLGRRTSFSARVTQIEYDPSGRSELRIEAGLSIGAGRGDWY